MKNKLSKNEIKIMDYILSNDISIITSQQIYEYFNESEKHWKKSSIYATLRKLQNRNFMESQKEGRNICYIPKISKKEFDNLCSSQLPGSVNGAPFIYCSITDDLLSGEDIKRIKEIIAKIPD